MSDIKRVEFDIGGQHHLLTPDAEQSVFALQIAAPGVPMGSAVAYTGKVTVTDEADNQASLAGNEENGLVLMVQRTLPAPLHLIYDRTQADVDRVFALKKKILTGGVSSLTEEEYTEYLNGLRGAYNHTDMNRVGEAVAYIADRFTALPDELTSYRNQKGVADESLFRVPYDASSVVVSPKCDWSMLDVPTQAQVQTYLDNLAVLRRQLPLPEGTPEVPPTLDHLTYEVANDIEYLLVVIYEAFLVVEEDLYGKIDRAASDFFYSGEISCGE